jgi:MFS family permease
MTGTAPKLYGYRWVILAVFTLANLTIQVLWASYATITGVAARAMGVSDLKVGMLGMVFMIAFVPLSVPVSWAIDKYGYRRTVGLGAIMAAVFGVARGLSGNDYTLVLLASIGIAAAQPFLLNAWTAVPARWFPTSERATAVGIVTLGNLVGTGIGFAVTPLLLKTMTIPAVQLLYGAAAAASAVLFVALARESPPTPPDAGGGGARALMLDGLRHALAVPSFRIYLFVCFVGMGIFNGLATWVEPIIRPRGFSPDDAGDLGALMLVGGVLGAVILPALSDRQRKRRRYLFIGVALSIPWLLGLAYATTTWQLLTSAFLLGFFLVSAAPVGMQYAAEISQPTPEGTSNGIVQLFGQVAVVFVYGMEELQEWTGSWRPPLLAAAALLAVSALMVLRLEEPASLRAPVSAPPQAR